MKKETTLGAVKDNGRFIFGGVEFVRIAESAAGDELVRCYIGDTKSVVHISVCAWVEMLAAD